MFNHENKPIVVIIMWCSYLTVVIVLIFNERQITHHNITHCFAIRISVEKKKTFSLWCVLYNYTDIIYMGNWFINTICYS